VSRPARNLGAGGNLQPSFPFAEILEKTAVEIPPGPGFRAGPDTYEFEYKLGKRTSLVGEYDTCFDSYNGGLKWRVYTQESTPVEKNKQPLNSRPRWWERAKLASSIVAASSLTTDCRPPWFGWALMVYCSAPSRRRAPWRGLNWFPGPKGEQRLKHACWRTARPDPRCRRAGRMRRWCYFGTVNDEGYLEPEIP